MCLVSLAGGLCLRSEVLLTQNDRQALAMNTPSAEALILRSLIHLLTTKLPEALEQVSSALRLDPDNVKAKSLRVRVKTLITQKEEGNQLYKEDCWDQAVEKYRDALEVRATERVAKIYSTDVYSTCRRWEGVNRKREVVGCGQLC